MGRRTWAGAALILIVGGLFAALPIAWTAHKARKRSESRSAAIRAVSAVRTALYLVSKEKLQGRPWTGDLAGLHHAVLPGEAEPLRYIPAEMAAADPGRPGAKPYFGYWIVLLPDKEGSPAKVAACAYPVDDSLGLETWLWAVDGGIMLSRRPGPPPPRNPSRDDLVRFWSHGGGG